MRLALLLCVLPLTGCLATAGDIRKIADQVEVVETSLLDETKTTDDILRDLEDLGETIGEVAEDVETRAEDGLDAIKDLGLPGGLSLLAAMGLNLYRNQRRKDRDEKV